MADNRWQDTSGDFAAAGNWSNGAKPAAADITRIFSGVQDITTGYDQSAVTITTGTLAIAPPFAGTLGTPANPLNHSGTWALVNINSPLARSININANATNVVVSDTHTDDGAFYYTAGTAAAMLVRKGRGVRIGGSATVTALRVAWVEDQINDARIRIDSGATITAATQVGGIVTGQSDVGTLNILGGEWIIDGSTEGDVTTVNLWGGVVRFEPRVTGQVITTVNGYGGTLDCSGNPYEKTLTTVNAWSGFTLNIDNGVDTVAITNAINVYGNPTIIKDPSRTLTIEAIST